MDFTREPVIETIITPREGYKLTLRSGKQSEVFSVESVEVVSFNGHIFFRSQEKPTVFLLPCSEYEIVETKQARMTLKASDVEGDVKIGRAKSGKESDSSDDKKRDKKRVKKKKVTKDTKEESAPKVEEKGRERVPSEPRTLIPPPATLIAEKIEKEQKETVEKPVEVEKVELSIPTPDLVVKAPVSDEHLD